MPFVAVAYVSMDIAQLGLMCCRHPDAPLSPSGALWARWWWAC